jgi:hypothetical protein
MKIHAALATIIIAAAIGPLPANAADKTARLSDPATTGTVYDRTGVLQEARLGDDASALSQRDSGLSGVERGDIQAAVRGQIQALATRNADAAFSFLSPLAQQFFVDPPTFLTTLNRQMIPVMYAKRFALTGLEREAGDAVQHVVFTGPKNHEWVARFKVERQPDGAWLVKGCHVELARGQLT